MGKKLQMSAFYFIFKFIILLYIIPDIGQVLLLFGLIKFSTSFLEQILNINGNLCEDASSYTRYCTKNVQPQSVLGVVGYWVDVSY